MLSPPPRSALAPRVITSFGAESDDHHVKLTPPPLPLTYRVFHKNGPKKCHGALSPPPLFEKEKCFGGANHEINSIYFVDSDANMS